MLKRIFLLGTLFLCSMSIGISAQEKPTSKCAFNGKGGDYRLVNLARESEKVGTVELRIYVEPKNFNAAFIRKLAQRLKAEYCNDIEVFAVIFDDRKLAKNAFFMDDYIQSAGKSLRCVDFTRSKPDLNFANQIIRANIKQREVKQLTDKFKP